MLISRECVTAEMIISLKEDSSMLKNESSEMSIKTKTHMLISRQRPTSDTFSSKKQFNVDFMRMHDHRGANLTDDRAKADITTLPR